MSIYVREGATGALHGLGQARLSPEAMRMTRIVTQQTGLLTQALTQQPVAPTYGPGMFEDPAGWAQQQASQVPMWAWAGAAVIAVGAVGVVVWKVKQRRGR